MILNLNKQVKTEDMSQEESLATIRRVADQYAGPTFLHSEVRSVPGYDAMVRIEWTADLHDPSPVVSVMTTDEYWNDTD